MIILSRQIFFIAAVLLNAILGVAHAQAIYKCGSNYSQMPCASDAKPIELKPNGTTSLGLIVRHKDDSTAEQKALSAERCIEAVRKQLKDPDSAKFREVERHGITERAFPPPNGPIRVLVNYSGFVNAKNSYGGYTGDRLFFCKLDQTETKIINIDIYER